MKKALVAIVALAGVLEAMADPTPRREISIDQMPRLGVRFSPPALEGASSIGATFKKPRKWIVLETKYSTYQKWQDQLRFTWHVLLETKSATEKTSDRKAMAPYSYFTTSVNYANVPDGVHSAGVCLHPSYLERFGDAKAVGLVIENKNGEVIAYDCVSEVTGIAQHPKKIDDAFWNKSAIMDAKDKAGKPMIERRQGLQDRSKTIWALVNPSDYELVVQ